MDLRELLRFTYSMFRPPKPQTVSEWADENRVLTSESASEPGPWRTDRAPYQREIMDAFTQPGVYEIVVMASAQVGKSEIELNMLGRAIDNDPGPMLYVQPTDKVAEDYSKRRIAPMFAACPTLARQGFQGQGARRREHHYHENLPRRITGDHRREQPFRPGIQAGTIHLSGRDRPFSGKRRNRR